MKNKLKIAVNLVSALFLGVGSLAAQAATEVWDTGQDVSLGVDQRYAVVGFINAETGNTNAPYFLAEPSYTSALGLAYVYTNGAYPGGVTFISNAANGGNGLNTIVYQVTFNLDAMSTISGRWSADNGGVIYNAANGAGGVFVAGLATENNGPDSNYRALHDFTFSGEAGSNVLTFYITDGGAPSAFAFDVQSVVAAAVPGPIVGAGLPGLLMALSGLIALRRRRVAAA